MENISNYMPTGVLETANLLLIIDNILFPGGQDIAGDSVTETYQQFFKPLHVHSQIFLIALLISRKPIYPESVGTRFRPQWKENVLSRPSVNRHCVPGTVLMLEEDMGG